MVRLTHALTAVLVFTGCAAGPAAAQDRQQTRELEVSLELLGACDALAASDILFDPVPAATSEPVAAEGTITVSCPAGSSYIVEIDLGQHSAGNVRRLLHAGDPDSAIPYSLSKDAAGAEPWGSRDQGTQLEATSVDGTPQVHTVHAHAVLAGDEPAGRYLDTVTVALSF